MRYRVLNNGILEFFDATANTVGSIGANGTNMKITANNGVIELGNTPSDVQVGTAGTLTNWTFLGGGSIGAGGIGTISMGQSGDTVNMNVAGVTYQYPSSFLRFNEISGANNKINITTQVPGSVILTLPNRPVVGALTLTDNIISTSNTTGTLTVGGGLGVSGNVNVSNTLSIITESAGNRPFTMQPGISGSQGARFGVVNESIDFYTTGGYPIWFATNGPRSAIQLGIATVASAVNYLQIAGNTTGGGVVLSGQGSDTNVGINITPKGNGSANITSITTSTSNTTGALVVRGGLGVTGNVVSNSFITSTDTTNYLVRLDGFGASGPKIEFGSPSAPNSFMSVGAYNSLNNIDTGSRNFRIGSPTVTNIMLANAATGVVTFANNVIVSGNLTVIGNVSVENVQSFAVSDPLIQLGIGNYTSDLRDIGFAAHYNDGTNAHTGFIRDSGTKEYYLFQGYTPELSANNNIVLTDPSFRLANVYSSFFKGNVITGGSSFITIAGNTTSSPPTMTSGGSDADVSMNLVSKGAGSINFIARGAPVVTMASGSTPFGVIASPFIFSPTIPGAWGSKLTLPGDATATIQTPDSNSLRFGTFGGTGVGSYSGNTQFEITHTGSAVNYLSVTGNTTSNGPVLSAEGTSANIDINIRPKGAGSVNIQSNGASTYLNLRTPVGVAIANVTASGACVRSQIVTFAPGNGSEANLLIYTTGASGLPPATAKISSLTGKSTLQVEGGQSASINIITLGASSTATANLQIRSGIGGSFSGDAGVLIYGKTNSLKLLHTGTGSGSRFDMGIDFPGGGADFATANITSNLVDGTSSLRVIGGNRADFKLSANGALGFTSFDVENIGTGNNIVYANVVSSFGEANVQILGQQVGSGPGSARLRIFSNATANLTIESGSTGLSPSASLRIVGAGSAPAYANIGSTTSAASQVNIISSLPSTSNTTGALVVTGGVGISGNVYADNVFSNNAILLTANNYTTYADPVGTAVALAIALG